MSQHSDLPVIGTHDPVSNVLKWILLAVAVLSFALLGWRMNGRRRSPNASSVQAVRS